MQTFFLLLTVIISRAVPSPIAQLIPDDSFDIALSGYDTSGIAALEPFQLAQSEVQPQEAPAQAPPGVLQPGDPAFRQGSQPKPELPSQPTQPIKQPFPCGEGKTAACCVGGTRDGLTAGCISYVPWDDWCQNQEFFKCCKAQPEKDAQIASGAIADDHMRADCDDPKEVEWSTQQRFQNFGNSILRVIAPEVNTGVSFPKPIWIPGQ